jgi:hypothetical protein
MIFWFCILDTQQTVQWYEPMIDVLTAYMGENASDNITATS